MSKMKTKYWTTMKSPVGELFIAGRDGKITDVLFRRPKKGFPGPVWVKSDKPFGEIKKQLGEYFKRERKKFDLELAPEATPFQFAAWRQLLKIPYGETISFEDIVSTKMACPDYDETVILESLGSATSYKIENLRLILYNNDIKTMVLKKID